MDVTPVNYSGKSSLSCLMLGQSLASNLKKVEALATSSLLSVHLPLLPPILSRAEILHVLQTYREVCPSLKEQMALLLLLTDLMTATTVHPELLYSYKAPTSLFPRLKTELARLFRDLSLASSARRPDPRSIQATHSILSRCHSLLQSYHPTLSHLLLEKDIDAYFRSYGLPSLPTPIQGVYRDLPNLDNTGKDVSKPSPNTSTVSVSKDATLDKFFLRPNKRPWKDSSLDHFSKDLNKTAISKCTDIKKPSVVSFLSSVSTLNVPEPSGSNSQETGSSSQEAGSSSREAGSSCHKFYVGQKDCLNRSECGMKIGTDVAEQKIFSTPLQVPSFKKPAFSRLTEMTGDFLEKVTDVLCAAWTVETDCSCDDCKYTNPSHLSLLQKRGIRGHNCHVCRKHRAALSAMEEQLACCICISCVAYRNNGTNHSASSCSCHHCVGTRHLTMAKLGREPTRNLVNLLQLGDVKPDMYQAGKIQLLMEEYIQHKSHM